MLQLRKCAAFMILCCAGLTPALGQTGSGVSLTDDDRAIIALALSATAVAAPSVLVESTAPVCRKEVGMLCINESYLTGDKATWDFPDGALLRRGLVARNATPANIGPLDSHRSRVSRERIDMMFRPGRYGWPDLQRAYPDVQLLVQVSAPAYSPDASLALIYVESLCDGRCGGGALLLFERQSGTWKLSRHVINWIG
jgi:hypothetical protein